MSHPITCGAEYDGIPRECAAGTRTFACTLAPDHNGGHEDHVSDAPNVLAWDAPQRRASDAPRPSQYRDVAGFGAVVR